MFFTMNKRRFHPVNQTPPKVLTIYGFNHWIAKRRHVEKMSIAEMQSVRWMCVTTYCSFKFFFYLFIIRDYWY